MHPSTALLSSKLTSLFFAAALAVGLVPTAAFAASDSLSPIPEGNEGAVPVASSAEEEGRDVLALPSDTDPSVDGDGAASTSEDVNDSSIINQTLPLNKPVAQQESTRSYFLAQTLESTKTVPIVSASLPLDKGMNQGPEAGADGETIVGSEDEVTDGGPSVSAEGESGSEPEGGDDSDEFDLGGSAGTLRISTESTVVGSFTYRGITYAVEPGGESVVVVASDYAKLPEEFVEARAIVLSSVVTADGIDFYSVSRIADDALVGVGEAAAAVAGNSKDADASSAIQWKDESPYYEDDAVTEVSGGEDDEGMLGITALVIPASVTEIGDDAFTGADTLQYVFVADENPTYSSYDGALYDADLTTLLYVPEARSGELFVAPTTVDIGPDVFSRCLVDALIMESNSAVCQLLEENGDEYRNRDDEPVKLTAGDEAEGRDSVTIEQLQESRPSLTLLLADLETDVSSHVASDSSSRITNGGVYYNYVNPIVFHASPHNNHYWMYCTYGSDGGANVSQMKNGDWHSTYPNQVFNSRGEIWFTGEKYSNLRELSGRFAWFEDEWSGWRMFYYDKTWTQYRVQFSGPTGRTSPVPSSLLGSCQAGGQNLGRGPDVWLDRFISVMWDPQGASWTEGSTTYNYNNPKYVESSIAYPFSSAFSGFSHPKNVYSNNKTLVFYGWNDRSDATPRSTSGWHYTVDGKHNNTTTWQPLTLYPIFNTGYPIVWDVERFGGVGASVEQMTSTVVSGNGNTVSMAAGAANNKKEMAVISDTENRAGEVVFPVAVHPKGESGDVRFLGWTNQKDGSVPVDDEGSIHDYFMPGERFVVAEFGLTNVSNADDVFVMDNKRGDTWYAVWETDVTFEARSYGGKIEGGSEGAVTLTVLNNRPIEQENLPSNDRSNPDSTGVGTYEAKVVPERAGEEDYDASRWTFKGWTSQENPNSGEHRTTADSTGLGCRTGNVTQADRDAAADIESTEALRPDGATTYYGVWECEVSWEKAADSPEGTAFADDPKTASYLFGYDVVAPVITATPASHHFTHWSDRASNTSQQVEGNHIYTVLTGGPVTAHWAPNEGTVVLNGQGTDASPVADQDTYAIYGQALRLHPSASDGSSWDEGRALRAPTRQGYVFAGYWNTRYTETEGAIESDVPRTDGTTVPSVEAKCYLEVDADGNLALVDGLVWDVTDPARQLFAHWRYDVLFDANAAGSSSGTASVRHKGSIMPMGPVATQDGTYQSDVWGNRYYYADYDGDDLSITKANALYGAPVKLPWATERTDADGRPAGYDDTCAWKASLSEESPIFSVDTEGFTVEEGGEAKVALAVAPGSDGTVTLYADWTDKAHEFVVTLDAGSLALSSDGSVWENETLTGVVYDKTLREAGVTAVGVPYRNGYTFAGFYTQAEGGSSYIDAAGMPVSGKPWAETAEVEEDGARHVALYARWVEDAYRIVYDLSLPAENNDALAEKTPGRQTIEGSAPVASQSWAYGSAPSHDGGVFPVAQTSPATAQGSFFRNGYDFQGWYWVDENGEAVTVSGADGSPRGTFAPSLVWQRAHKGGLASDAAATSGTLVLYAAWIPKVYGLVFDLDYQEQADRVLPDETMAGMISPNEVKERNGAYYYEVAYEADLTPFFEGSGASAVPCAPTDAPYTFAGWRVKGGLGDGSALALTDAAGDVNETALSGAFMPAYPLSTRTVGEGGAPAVITYRGEWTAPEPVKVRLRADVEGDPVRGRFVTASFPDIDPALVESATEQELVLKDVGYALDFDLMGARSPYRPRASAGYTLAGFVRTDADGRILDAQGRPTAETDPYDGSGELKSGLPLVSSLSKLTEDAYAVAVYSRNRMIVELDMSEIPQKPGYEGYTLYTEVDGTYEEGWSIDGSPHDSPVYAFDVTAPPFALPDDVVVAGYAFCGWERAGSAEMVPDGYVFDPSRIAADPNLSRQTFKPVFEEKVYEVSFLDNHADGQGGSRKATVTFEGAIVDAGDFAGLEGCEVGATLPMASVPEPETASNDPSHTGSDAAYEHYHSYPFSLWRIGSPYSTQADVQERSANEAVTADEWSAWIERFSQTTPGARAKTETLAVYAVWARAISAVLPLRADVALDADTGSVALPDEAHAVYGVGLQKGEALEVASLRCEGVAATVFDMRVGAPVRLTVFADAASKPSMGAPSVDADGFIRGDYGGNARGKLSVDLGRSASSFGKGELEAAGFRPFTAGEAAEGSSGSLAMRFGLDLDGCAIEEVRALRAQLPDPNGELDENGWTRAALPVARLLYTVQIAQ